MNNRETTIDAEATRTVEDPPPAGRSLGGQVGRGAAWAAASNLVMRFASIAVTAFLARVLNPDDFGVFAIALAVYLVVASLAELGMGSAVARSVDEPDDIAPTVATISLAISTALGVAMAAGAGQLAAALGQPGAAEPLRVLALSLVLTGVFAVPGAQLVREFRQDRIFLATVVGFLVANPILVLLAQNGGGATAFAWSRVIGTLATGLVLVASTSRRYRPGWRRDMFGPLVRFGLPLSLANLVNWSLLNADYMIMGRMLTATEVGVYTIAFNVANWSTAVLGSVLNSVLVPAFGRVHHDRRRFGEALASATRLVALIAFPIAALTLALAGPLVESVFGAKWVDSAPVLEVLSLYGVLYAFSLLFVNVLVAGGATGRLLVVQLAWIAVLGPAIIVGLRILGLPGVAWAHVVAISLVAIPSYLWAVRRLTGQRLWVLVRVAATPALAAAAAGIVAWLVAGPFGAAWPAFLLGGTAGGLTYLAVAGPMILRLLPERIAGRLRGYRGAHVAERTGRHR